MRRNLPRTTLLAALTALWLSGCGEPKKSAEHAEHGDEHEHAEGEASVRFKAGRGLQLAPETVTSLGLKTAAIEERPIAQRHEITAAVFDAGPPARASALVPSAIADDIERHPPSDAKVLHVSRDVSPALAQVEVILAVPGNPSLGSTLTLSLQTAARTVLAVPQSAVLRSATGSFVFAVNDGYFLRTPVKTGASDGEAVEILEGLYAGDEIVTAGVEQLWLTELRLTKGGGHSH